MANRYDDAVKALCAIGLSDLCDWLGVETTEPVPLLRLSESAPPATTRQVDLLVEVDPSTVLHVEFQTHAERRFAERMLDYWVRIDASLDRANLEILQHVVHLGDGRLGPGVARGNLRFSFAVHAVRSEDPERFLARAGLVPFAALARMPDASRAAALAKALSIIADVEDDRRRETLGRATVVLAAVRLDPATITKTWEESAMPIPNILDRVYDEGRDEGEARGRELGLIQAVASLLQVRFGGDERIDAIAERLAGQGATSAMAAVEQARSLDDLA
jgi:predicted transposase YdaD